MDARIKSGHDVCLRARQPQISNSQNAPVIASEAKQSNFGAAKQNAGLLRRKRSSQRRCDTDFPVGQITA
jgi:hypothetical protein